MNERLTPALRAALPEMTVLEQEPMAKHISFRLGGPAALMAFPRTVREMAETFRLCREAGEEPVLLGAGTNVLAPDEGIDAPVICTRESLTGMTRLNGTDIEVYAGETLARAAMFAREHGLSGLEFAHGIPGTVGGGVFMNAGAYGGEILQVAAETAALYRDGTEKILSGAAQGFGYRTSAFQHEPCVVTRTVFHLTHGDREAIRRRMQELSERRRASQPLELPSAGSTFKRPAGGYAAALIDGAGLKGLAVGGAMVSPKHAGFVVNAGGATCADVLALIAEIQKRVFENSGIRLEPEVRVL